MTKAIKSDWKTLDMPEKTASFSIDIGLTEGEFSALQMVIFHVKWRISGLNTLKIISCIFTVAGLVFVFIRFGFPRTEE